VGRIANLHRHTRNVSGDAIKLEPLQLSMPTHPNAVRHSMSFTGN
jgi:hypothetical protein